MNGFFSPWFRGSRSRTVVRRPSSRKSKKPRLNLERLEDRLTPSVDAFIATGPGGPTLYVFDRSDFISGSNQLESNDVTISRDGDLVRVFDPFFVFTDGSAAASGANFADFDVSDFDDMKIDLQTGDDSLRFDNTFTSDSIDTITLEGGDPSGS